MLLHLPGIRAGQLLERLGLPDHFLLPMFMGGYLDTTLLLLLVILTLRWLRDLAQHIGRNEN